MCPDNMEWYICTHNDKEEWRCFNTLSTAQYWCETEVDAFAKATPANCGGSGETGNDDSETTFGGSSWDPSLQVSYDPASDIYEIEADFAHALVEDGFAPLSIYDSSRLVATPSGYYRLDAVRPGDLAAELGLETDDLLLSVNGHDLGSLDAQIAAFQAVQASASFELELERSGRVVEQRYALVP